MGLSYVTMTPNIMGLSQSDIVLPLMGLSYVPETHNYNLSWVLLM